MYGKETEVFAVGKEGFCTTSHLGSHVRMLAAIGLSAQFSGSSSPQNVSRTFTIFAGWYSCTELFILQCSESTKSLSHNFTNHEQA